MTNKVNFPKTILALTLCIVALGARAATFFDDFESYAVGSNLHGQGGWAGWAGNASAGALVTTNFAFSPTRSVNITGASDLVHTFVNATNDQWVFSVMQYIPSTSTGTTYVVLMNTYRPPYGATDLNWSVQIQNNMVTGQIISDLGGSATLPMIKDQWMEVRCEINLASNSVSEFYNGQLLSTHAWQDGSGLNEIQALDLFANNAAPVYYDNVSLAPVTPPVITEQPQSQTNVIGSNVAFSVTVTGTPPLSYQWRFNGTNTSGATNATYTILNAQTNNAGTYDVVVSNSGGSVTSAPAMLSILPLTQLPFFDNFESYAVGSNLHGQGGWAGWAGNASAGALVSTNFAFSPTRSVNITGASDLVHTFFGATNDQWVFSVMQYIPSTSTGDSYVILLNKYQAQFGAADLNWSVQIQCNMDTGQIISDRGGSATLPMVKDKWVEVRCEINLASNSVSEFYNGQLLSKHAWQDGTGLNEIQALDLFANNAAPVYYDNVSLGASGPAPPVLTCASNKTVECGTNWVFDPPTVVGGGCSSNLTISVLSTLANGVAQITFTGGGSAANGQVFFVGNTATSGFLDITTGTNMGTYTLSPGSGTNAGFLWDGLIFPASDPFIDVDGLLFTNSGHALNLFGNGPGSYSLIGAPTNLAYYAPFVTNGVATLAVCPQVITRTWLFTDACGNSNTCSQTVTVVDTTPPTLTCATNKTVQCGTAWAFDPPTASDACSGTKVTIGILSTVTNGSACSQIITRIWLATDLCGNSNSCAQTVTVVATGPPVITQEPQGQTNVVGSGVPFSVTATGLPPLSYQWRFNGTNTSGATNVTYTILNAQTNNAGTYDVVVSNSGGSVTSAPAMLSILPLTDLIGKNSAITPDPNGVRILWAATPARSYQLNGATNVEGPYTPVAGHTNMMTLTNWNSTVVPTTRPAQFFKLFQHDTDGPLIDNLWPADRAFAIEPQDPITARITDATGINLNSLSIQVGANAAIHWPDSRLTFANNFLTYTPASESWGPTGATVTATLSVADTLGNSSTNTWSFRLLSPLVLASTVVFVDTGNTSGPGPHLTLVSATGSNTFVYSYPDASSGVTNGMCLVNTNVVGTNNYSYGRVVRSFVDDPSSQTVFVFTRRAALTDIYQSGSFRFHVVTVTPPLKKSKACASFGNETLWSSSNPNITIQTTPNTQICVDGSLEGGIDVSWGCCFLGICPCPTAGIWVRPSVTLSGELALQGTISANNWSSGNQNKHITTISVAQFIIPPGIPADVSVLLDLPWSASFNGTLNAKAGFDFSETACYTVGVGSGTPPSGNCSSSSFTPIYSLSGCGSGELKVGFSAGFQLGILDNAAYVTVATVPYLKADASAYCAGLRDDFKISLCAGLEMSLTLGYDVLDIFSGSKTWSWDLIDCSPVLGSPYSGDLGPCPGACQPVRPGNWGNGAIPWQGQVASFLDVIATPPVLVGPATYLWGRLLGSNIFLPFTDDPHIFNTTGDTLHIRNLAASDAGTLAAQIQTPGGVAFFQSQLQIAPPPPTNSSFPSLVWIPPGIFLMGSPTNEAERSLDEVEHSVTISRGFYIGKFEITQEEYFAVTGNNPSFFSGTNLPVETVTWAEATNYCRLLTQQAHLDTTFPTNWLYRLPTEAEWEYACRTNAGGPSGTLTTPKAAFCYGPALLGQMANFYGLQEYDSSTGSIAVTNQNFFVGQTTAVGTYVASAAGLYDMHGNVAEWCLDWYAAYPTNSVTDPQGPGTGADRVYRGGHWHDSGRNCRAAQRFSTPPTSNNMYQGFRVVLAPQ
jgi:formylglycine-generating enzyme required for sulfatase activity